MNQLGYEKSPYLLQHKENPVNWYAWKEETFAKAQAEDKPVFLSIGYSTCHWCHVMAHESFEDEKVAEVLNRHFISVKVDREERPDVDAVYMQVCQSMTGSGGWPLTIVMTPDRKPFFAGTYFPKYSRYGMTGILELLEKIAYLWRTDRKKLLDVGERIAEIVQRENKPTMGEVTKAILQNGVLELRGRFDGKWGGFGVAPKFPTPHNNLFLLRYGKRESDIDALFMAEKTLDGMALGGLFDQIGGGFSRYSTDEKWLVPHFEKMLYDNALLAYLYAEGYTCLGKTFYRRIAEKTLQYLLWELQDTEGGFYCGQDADSEGVEGKYYIFTPAELKALLGEYAGAFCKWFHITEQGNFEGKNIPNRLEELPQETENEMIEELCKIVLEYRQKRTSLHKDDKILTAWNGLTIAAFAKAGQIFADQTYLETGKRCAAFIENNLTEQTGRLYLRYRDGEAAHMGQLDDYAFYAFGLLELYRATLEIQYLERAENLAELVCSYFADEAGGFYLYAEDAEQLLYRPKESYDGAMPSGNSVMGYILQKLAALTGKQIWQAAAEKQFSYLAGEMQEMPSAHCFGLYAMTDVLYPSMELVCVSAGSVPGEELKSFLRENSGISVLWKTKETAERLSAIAPFTKAYSIPETGERYYLCKGKQCFAPQESVAQLKLLLQE